ncbi:hypothetical protein ElyMa_004106700 [Elysia marginata]|uniref:Uncharacterized protein n=1 Tax=Elysia marginata TaxID=1093978 RepID=A0AAV4GB73_9GAST|nr:hypothetical protein ElyMa_004106700 [Elysia marginata]
MYPNKWERRPRSQVVEQKVLFNTTFHNAYDSKTDESSRAAVQPQARRQASASFADLRYCTEYRVKGDQFHHSTNNSKEIVHCNFHAPVCLRFD